MFKSCKYCYAEFYSMKSCKRHIEKRICLKKTEKKWENLKKNMKICDRCYCVLSSQYSLDRHITRQVPCKKKDLKKAIEELEKEYYDKDKYYRKKFLLKKEILNEKLGISIERNNNISISEKPEIKLYNDIKYE